MFQRVPWYVQFNFNAISKEMQKQYNMRRIIRKIHFNRYTFINYFQISRTVWEFALN